MGATTTSAAPRLSFLLLWPIALAAAGCGDEILCDSSPLVVIQAPTSAISADVDSVAPGVQTDVHVRSTLLPADELELIVLDGAGAMVTTLVQPVGAGGMTVFPGVTVPEPRARLRAVGRSECGHAEDELELDVTGGPGCAIEIVSPTAPVTADAAPAVPGSQVDIELAVAPACAGRMVTSTCGANSPQGVVPASGRLTLRADLCGSSPCELRQACTFRVTSPEGVPTQATAAIEFDDQGPAVSVAVISPEVACGGQVTPAGDVAPGLDGMQIRARVTAANALDAKDLVLELDNTGGPVSMPAPANGEVQITLEPGLNVLTSAATDTLGNRGRSAACTIAFADMAVAVAAPAADGLLGRRDGTISGGALAFSLCGTVDRMDVAVAVRIDGGPPQPATVTGTSWCVALSLAEAAHDVMVSATKGYSYGGARFALGVDLTPPPEVLAVPATSNRQRVALAWPAPADGGGPVAGYLVKVSTTPLTEANFDTQGTVIATGPPQAPGVIETAELSPARLGTQYWLGVAAVDLAGNRSPAKIAGPLVPAFDRIGPAFGPNPGQGELAMGAAIAHGKFNDDPYDDLAVAAPTQNAGGVTRAGAVHVYFGGPAGIPAVPSLSILGTTAEARTGASLAAVRWKGPFRDDLVIGAPGADGGAGRVYVLGGGPGYPTGTITVESIALQLGVSATAPGWFANGRLGTSLAAADVDGDSVLDLVAAAARGGGGRGGLVIFYGGTVSASVALSDTDPSGLAGATVEYMPDPLALPNRAFGTYLHAVGPTRGELDLDDDLVVGYEDDASTTDRVYVIRGNGMRPAAGLALRAFTPGRDVRLELVSPYAATEFGSQAVSVVDLNGDGAAELAISAYKHLNGGGQVVIVDGDTVGVDGVAKLTDPGVVVTTIDGATGMRLGAVLVAHDTLSVDDVDGDGQRDFMVGAVVGGVARLYVWFGGAIPKGKTSIASAGASIAGPAVFAHSSARPRGPAGQGRWIGDLNGDGLDDICWASPYDSVNNFDGAFVVLFDGQS
jgi:hypothetical protein